MKKRYEVVAGSGCDSGVQGRMIDKSEVPTKQTGGGIIPDIEGHYKPMSEDDRAIRTDDGKIVVMHKDRLKVVIDIVEAAASGQLETDVVTPSDALDAEIEKLSIEYAEDTYTNPTPTRRYQTTW